MLARWAMLFIVATGLPYLRSSGAGSTLLASTSRKGGWPARIVTIFTFLIGILVGGSIALAVAAVIVFAMRAFYRRWMGGVTGDLIGACGELVEIAVLVTIAS
jgi:adenosylcobinamide-GDP ribazoletransferase